ncbi:MAG: HlyD family efflux transporter periplasmic adaptor subunit [Bacteroidetes bacterium]|nr:HlyD family efflux transporter periplasmic adaptor subunit [Bacteroidota bacterium]
MKGHKPSGHLDQLAIAKLLYRNESARILSYWLLLIFGLIFLAMFLPWQQNVRAYGKVTAFAPEDRPQKVYSTVPGMIRAWHIQEGQLVQKGDTLVVISEIKDEYFDPDILARKRSQINDQEQSISSLFEKMKSLDRQIDAMENGLRASLSKAKNKIADARYKIATDSADLKAYELNFETAKAQFDREEKLQIEGLVSLTSLEDKRMKMQEAQAKLQTALNKLQMSSNLYLNAILELSSLEAEYNDKISKAIADKNQTLSYINDLENKLTKMQIDIANLEIRQQNYVVRAPQEGYVVRADKSGVGEILKEGDALLTIMPANPQLATELFVTATDLPLLSKGNKVRIRFDGWPALVFSGWPNASLGTFGGEIQVIDYVNNHENLYRILVTPDPNDEPWPEQIRIGSGVYGWTMLDNVPIWYEIWRQLNGFPPNIDITRTSPKSK